MKKTFHFSSGQTLVLLLVFASVAIIITAGAVAVTIINSQTTSKFALGEETRIAAEAGAEEAILRLLRTPNYSGNLSLPTLTVGNATATITISGIPNVTITSIGKIGDFVRKIQVDGTFQNNQFTVSSWKEID